MMRTHDLFPVAVAFVVVLCFSVLAQDARAETDERARARRVVREFERSMREHMIDTQENLLVSVLPEAQRQEIRDFFAQLENKEMKLAALGMMHRSNGSVIPPDLMGQLAMRYLFDPDTDLQFAALQGLTYTVGISANDQELSARLLELSEADSAEMRRLVAMAMCRTGDPVFLPAIHRLMEDEATMVREVAIFEWGTWNTVNRSRYMLPRTIDPDPEVASAAIMYLAVYSDSSSGTDAVGYLRSHYQSLEGEGLEHFVAGMNRAVEKSGVTQAFAESVLSR